MHSPLKFNKFIYKIPSIFQLLGEIMCGLIPFATTLAILVNSFILVGIAMDRFVAVVPIIKGAWEPSKIFCMTFAVAVWGLAAGKGFSFLYFW